MINIESVQLRFRSIPWQLSSSHKKMAMTLIASVATTLDVLGKETSLQAVLKALEDLPQTDRSQQIVQDAMTGLTALAAANPEGSL